jgi:ParB-like chromosome segregation protein Spo0J
MIIDEMISSGHARALIPVEDPKQQYELAQRVFDEKLSVREVEKLVKDLGKEKKERKKKEEVYANYAKGNQIVHQLIDLALLQNGMLKGEALNNFVKRSVELIK